MWIGTRVNLPLAAVNIALEHCNSQSHDPPNRTTQRGLLDSTLFPLHHLLQNSSSPPRRRRAPSLGLIAPTGCVSVGGKKEEKKLARPVFRTKSSAVCRESDTENCFISSSFDDGYIAPLILAAFIELKRVLCSHNCIPVLFCLNIAAPLITQQRCGKSSVSEAALIELGGVWMRPRLRQRSAAVKLAGQTGGGWKKTIFVINNACLALRRAERVFKRW